MGEGASLAGWVGVAGESVGAGEQAGDECAEGRIVAGITPGGTGLAERSNAALSLATTYPYASLSQVKEAPDFLTLKLSAIPWHFVLGSPLSICSVHGRSAESLFPKLSSHPL